VHAIPGSDVDTWIGELLRWLRLGADATFLRTARLLRRPMQVTGHRATQGILLEFEEAPGHESETLVALHPRLGRFLSAIEPVGDAATLARLAARELREITGFNRVFVCRFDADGPTILADDVDGMWAPASQLPLPCPPLTAADRPHLLTQRLHLIANTEATPSAVRPAISSIDERPLDLGPVGLRVAVPAKLQYLRSLGAAASLSISIVVDGRLWGLVLGHHRAPRRSNAQVRTVCDLLCQMLSLQIGAREQLRQSAA
jgi:light-regulated signal transduction histidine kinase (bacteriophytochrome)